MKKSYLTVTKASKLGRFSEQVGLKESRKVQKHGFIIRTGDIVRFGRVPILIKECNINEKQYDRIQERQKKPQLIRMSKQLQLKAKSR